jgi:hypothetical protein
VRHGLFLRVRVRGNRRASTYLTRRLGSA